MFGSLETTISSKVTEWFHKTNEEGSTGPEGTLSLASSMMFIFNFAS